MGVGVFVGFFNARVRPVRPAEDADFARRFVLVEDFDNRSNRHIGVIAMEDVEVDEISAEAGKGVVQVCLNIERGHTLAVGIVVCAFGHDHDLIAQPALVDPFAERALGVARAVAMCRVKGGAAHRKNII